MKLLTWMAVAALVCTGPACKRKAEARPAATPAEDRIARQHAAAVVAPAPEVDLPPAGASAWAFVVRGEDGIDADGYPRRHVDRAAVRALLLHRRFDDLTEVVERLQVEFEQDPRKEYWVSDAFDALGTGELELEPILDSWVAARGQSFAPYLARGAHWVERAWERRGGNWAAETPEQNFAAMKAALQRASADLGHALELRPRLVAAIRQQLRGALLDGDPAVRERLVGRALTVCISCYQVRVSYLHGSTPRWGGSYERMAEFARTRADPANPRMRLLPGFVELDRADLLEIGKDLPGALAAVERACALGDEPDFLLERAQLQRQLDRPAEALASIDRALAVRPGRPDLLVERAYDLLVLTRVEESARDLRAALRVDPANAWVKALLPPTVKALGYAGWTKHEAGDREGALRLYDLAAELAPNDPEVLGRRKVIVLAGRAALDDVAVAPDDFREMQQLDFQLAESRRFDRIVELWTEFLRRHPDEARAYLERGGAFFSMGRIDEARSDAEKACALGNSEACMRAKQIPGAR